MAVVPAAAQALAVLAYLSRQAGPVPAVAISRDVALPRSTTYHLLDTLIQSGFVVHLPEEGRYGLGLSSYELASGYARQAPLQRLARVPLAQLVDRTGYNAHLAVPYGREVIYVIEERAPGRPPLVTDVGVRLPAHVTASGRAMLAALPKQQVNALYGGSDEFVRRTDRGPASISALRRLLVEVRRVGYAEEDGDVTPNFASVAVAVLDHAGHPLAAVALTGPADEATLDGRRKVAAQVTRTAREIGRRVGGIHQRAAG